jgi:hypothetical protein
MHPFGDDVHSFMWRGRRLRLVGESRSYPLSLTDEDTGEVLWEYDSATVGALHPKPQSTLNPDEVISPEPFG